MNKTELIAAVAEKAEISKKDAEKAVKAFTDVVSEELVNGGKIQLVGFGTFEVSERPAREGRNPRTGETMTIAATKTPKFKVGKALKDMVNAESAVTSIHETWNKLPLVMVHHKGLFLTRILFITHE